jgi:hypothetical protein
MHTATTVYLLQPCTTTSPPLARTTSTGSVAAAVSVARVSRSTLSPPRMSRRLSLIHLQHPGKSSYISSKFSLGPNADLRIFCALRPDRRDADERRRPHLSAPCLPCMGLSLSTSRLGGGITQPHSSFPPLFFPTPTPLLSILLQSPSSSSLSPPPKAFLYPFPPLIGTPACAIRSLSR